MSERRIPMSSSKDLTKTQRASRPAGRESYSLLVSAGCGAFCRALPAADAVVLGRDDAADIVIDDDSVSRRHIALYLRGEPEIEDLGSKNGTRVQGAPLSPGMRRRVDVGAVVELGSAMVVLQRAALTVASAPPAPAETTSERRSSPHGPPTAEAPAMKHLYELLDVVAPTPLRLLILGETGVGKEVFARTVHERSPRRDRAFLSLNCAALPDSVLEGELFGYEKGAFTGAVQARAGLLESANGGTLFLDEVGELPLSTQAKLLRVLESGEVLRLGGRKPTHIDVRIVAATNRDVRAMVLQSTFRADLYYRLNGMTLTIPPLRQRREDIAPLARRFLAGASASLRRRAPELAEEACAMLEAYAWPGNVRELRNVMDRAAALCAAARLGASDLLRAAPELVGDASEPPGEAPDQRADAAPYTTAPPPERAADAPTPPSSAAGSPEKERVLAALATTHGNQKRAAEILGISRRTLVNRLNRYGIGRPRKATT